MRVATSPSCLSNSTEVVEVDLHQEAEVTCTMKWAGELAFRWVIVARDVGHTIDFPSSQFSQDGATSTLR